MRTILDTQASYDTEKGTSTQTRIIPLFEFHELNKDAQDRAVAAYMEERATDPYFSQWFSDCYERDIWECVRDLEKSITGARVSWQYNRWYSCDFDCEYSYNDCYDPGHMEPVKDDGDCYSMDLCDAWNAHIRKLNSIYYRLEYLDHLCDDVYYFEQWHMGAGPENEAFYNRLDDMRNDLVSAWYEELERACDDVRDKIEYLLRAEWEYYTSEECARDDFEANEAGDECRTCEYPYYKNGGYTGRVFYSDDRKWYLSNGEFFEQSDVNRECVSIVKAI